MVAFLFTAAILAGAVALAMHRAHLITWAIFVAAITFICQSGLISGNFQFPIQGFSSLFAWLPAIALGLASHPGLKRSFITAPVYGAIRKILPKVSDTEQQALDAGTIGFDAELFSGTPDWDKLAAIPPVELSPEEQVFLDGPTEELCAMIDDWQVRFENKEVPEEIWSFVKKHGFLGMLISKEHGGLGFSPQAQSLILGKIASRSPDVVTIVMVPNSLGPGELIEKYGTDEQKSYYLPRLAHGDEIPCFSLTGPTSGSDAATMRDVGYVTNGTHEGKDVLGVRLTWDKRYITLGPQATLVGLAFNLYDPDGLLDPALGEDVGITVALVPADHPGVNIGRRHLPTGAAFPNGPNWAEDVFIPMDWIIGGQARVGQGWRMLMECLSAGRAISLPSSATAGAKAMLRHTTAYARIRKQFGLPVGKMEGIEEPLVRIAETAYVNEAARGVTAALVSRGEKPSVISALMKYQTTEKLRQAVNDAMDIHGGRGICDGPKNYLQSAYQMVPVGITVEGANILTRTLITFAQGALRAHPYLYDEIKAAQDQDHETGLADFDKAFSSHISFSVSNVVGALFHNLTMGLFAAAPDRSGPPAHHYRALSRQSRNFALVSDMTIALLAGGLKTKQRITGRLADALSELYLASCVLKRFEDDGLPNSDEPIVDLAVQNALYRFQTAIDGTIANFPNTPARILMRWVVFPLGRPYRPASDALGRKVASLVLEPGDVRDRLTGNIYISTDVDDPTGLLEVTLAKVIEATPAEKKLDKAVREGKIRRVHGVDWIAQAAKQGIITESEAQLLAQTDRLVARTIAVDHFDPEEVKPNYMTAGHNLTAASQPQ